MLDLSSGRAGVLWVRKVIAQLNQEQWARQRCQISTVSEKLAVAFLSAAGLPWESVLQLLKSTTDGGNCLTGPKRCSQKILLSYSKGRFIRRWPGGILTCWNWMPWGCSSRTLLSRTSWCLSFTHCGSGMRDRKWIRRGAEAAPGGK